LVARVSPERSGKISGVIHWALFLSRWLNPGT
jgi:hypothetical protein